MNHYPPYGLVTLLPESDDGRNLMHLVRARRNRAAFHLSGYATTECGLTGLVGSSYPLPLIEHVLETGLPVVRADAGTCPWCLTRERP